MSRNLLKYKLNQAKFISTFDFSTLYTTIPHNLLLKVLSEVIKFAFKSKVIKRIAFSITSIYRTSKGAEEDISLNKLLLMLCPFSQTNAVKFYW